MTDATTSGQGERFVLDTNIVSYWFKRDTRATAYLSLLSGATGVVSAQTLGEALRWPLELGWSPGRSVSLVHFLNGFEVVSMTPVTAETWAHVVAHRKRAGRPISTADAWIAATALVLGIPLMTHNRRDFERIPGLDVISFG